MWNINKQTNPKSASKPHKDNRGLSLVELLIAFAVSGIILSALAYMILTTLNLYGRTNANVEVQNEAQTSLNLILDSILSAKEGVCFIETDASAIDPDSEEYVCAMFGDLDIADDLSMSFSGDAILWQPKSKEMYLITGTHNLGTATDKAQAPLEALTEMKDLLPSDAAGRLPYLMAQNVTGFSLKAEDSCFLPDVSGEPDKHYFKNPLILEVNMSFEYEYQNGRNITREIGDRISVRNRLNYAYIQREGSGMRKYIRSSK